MAYLNSRPRTPDVCPVCGEEVPPRALACRHCGADHNSGWKLNADAIDNLPDDDFDYDEFLKNEFGEASKKSPSLTLWKLTAAVLLIAFLVWGFLNLG